MRKIEIDYGEGITITFERGVSKRAELGDGYVMVAGKVRLADGSEHDAILEIDESSSGELCGTGVWNDFGVAWQGDDDFLMSLGRNREQIFPYKYKYDINLECDDHHVGEDGWSL